MNFANVQALHLLGLVPVIILILYFFYRHRLRVMARFVESRLFDEMAEGFSKKEYRRRGLLFVSCFVLLVLALTRPQWGAHTRLVKRHGLDIMVSVDVSKSMLTQDVKPSRLERTKLAVKDLIMKLNGSDHLGLMAFSGDAMLMCPFTYDYNGFLLSLDDLSVDSIPRGGTNIADAIDESVKAYQGTRDAQKVVILVTDGEEEEGRASDAARRAKAQGVRIFTVGVGTKEGDLIQIPGAHGQTEFLKDAQGNVIKSRLNENLLQQIAYITGGVYVRSAPTEFGLDYIYDRSLSKLKKQDVQAKMAKLYDERFQWPLTLAFGLLLIETFMSTRRRVGV